MTQNRPTNGRFPESYLRLAIAAAAFAAAAVTRGGPQDAAIFLAFGQYLLPPGPGRSAP
ncbi:hypothetical protein [Streptomyces sp. DSM 41534]